MAVAVVMASGCAIAKMAVMKAQPNTNVTHTPPPTGNLPTFFSEKKDINRNK